MNTSQRNPHAPTKFLLLTSNPGFPPPASLSSRVPLYPYLCRPASQRALTPQPAAVTIPTPWR